MSATVKKYAVIDMATGKDVVVYDNQAPATSCAKSRWKGQFNVEERTYELTDSTIVRRVLDGKVLKA